MADADTTCVGTPVSNEAFHQSGTATDADGTCYQLEAGLLLYDQIASALVERTSNGTWAVSLRSVKRSGLIADYTAKSAPRPRHLNIKPNWLSRKAARWSP